MAEIVTFFLTVVYAQSALLRIREYYVNKGKPLAEKVNTCIWIIITLNERVPHTCIYIVTIYFSFHERVRHTCIYYLLFVSLTTGQKEEVPLHTDWNLLYSQLVSDLHNVN